MLKARLNTLISQKQSWLCVGLDPDIVQLPTPFLQSQDPVQEFIHAVIDATAEWAVAYKPNFAFFESQGLKGLSTLETTMKALPTHAITIADIKRADIGHTSRHYARAFFEVWNFDAVTVPPYMGYDSLEPFFAYTNKMTFVLCLTSNSGAIDFELQPLATGKRLYEWVLEKAVMWNYAGNVGIVVGATHAELIGQIRASAPDLCFLVPGVGAQGGSLESALIHSVDTEKRSAVINISRALIYPDGCFQRISDFAAAVAQRAEQFV
ncbi:MAG: orotidine-5'-phosphate decarboxylase [Chloroherpetonaceae bacterium]|nr:orotidine-5'-phosphate decarboxylase [Chloroherpetonaceae bacterium]